MQPYTREAEWAINLLIWTGGVVSTVVGSWVASKIHVYHDNKKLHHNDLKQRVLIPLRTGLLEAYRPLAALERPAISCDWGRLSLKESPKMTEDQEEMGPVLKAADPNANVASALDEALLADAWKYHYEELVAKWQALATGWGEHVEACERWVARMGDQILQASGLPPHPSSGPYVMHLQLGVTVYQRLFGLKTDPVRKAVMSQWSSLTNGLATAAAGNDHQMDKLLEILDNIQEGERDTAGRLMAGSKRLAGEINSLSSELGLAIAERKLRGRCKMVTLI